MKVRIEPSDVGTLGAPGAKIHLDGEDYSRAIHTYKLEQGAGELPRLTLGCHVFEGVIDGEVDVWLTSETRELMLRLGWTPPEGDQEEAQA